MGQSGASPRDGLESGSLSTSEHLWPRFRRRLQRLPARWRAVLLVLLCVAVALSTVRIYEATRPPAQRLTQRDIDRAVARALASAPPQPSIESQAYARIHPSLVSIAVKLPGSGGRTRDGFGSGVMVDDAGNVLTAFHIVKDASQIRITFSDGTESDATVVATRPENDIAVVRPRTVPDNPAPATLASSATLNVGDEVVAVGSPFGIRNSLSSGVVSGLGRSFRSPDTGVEMGNLIQFDAAVNRGSSGGPLLNRNGEVVGVVHALVNPTGQDVFVGIGFAVPIEMAGGALGSPWF